MTGAGESIKTLSGEAVLQIIRDSLSNESYRIRSDQERFVAEGLNDRIEPGRLAVVLSLNAAVDIVTAIIIRGRDARFDAGNEKRKFAAKIEMEIVQELVGKARTALSSEWGGTVEDEDETGGSDGAAATE